jgi:two-component system response regulator YesN
MKLLIVEDEPRLRDSLVHNIPWEDNNIEVIGQAENGQQALEVIERIRPDLVLLDIQMPKMDGLSLAEEIVALDTGIRMIVLSGYDQFDYAQRAMQLGIDKYLLKPAEDTEILSAILGAAEQVRQELERKHSLNKLNQRWREHLPMLRDRVLQNWISGTYDAWELERWNHNLEGNLLCGDKYVIAVVEMDPLSESEARFSDKDTSLLQFSLQSIAKEALENDCCYVFADAEGGTVLMFSAMGSDSMHELIGRANSGTTHLLSVVKGCLKLTASAGIGLAVSSDKVPQSYKQAKQALRQRMLYGNDIAIPHHEDPNDEIAPVSSTETQAKQLELLLVSGDQEGSVEAVRRMLEAATESIHTVEAYQEQVLALNSMLVRIVHEQGVSLRLVVGEDFVYFLNVEALRTKDHILEWLIRAVRCISGYFSGLKQREQHHLIVSAKELINERLDQPLTLYGVAEMLFTTPSYFSRLFKQGVGKPFSDYVLDRKMERAKGLLLGGCKVYEACRSIGFRDVSYFTKVFRKYWGVTPSEIK